MTAPLADQLADYLTLRPADRLPVRRVADMDTAELTEIRRMVDNTDTKASYAKTRTGTPRKPFSVGDNQRPGSLRRRCIDIAPRVRGAAQPASWFALTLNEPTGNVGAALSDLFGRGSIHRRPAAKCDLDTAMRKGRTRQWVYWVER
jgi:hypothetical protein